MFEPKLIILSAAKHDIFFKLPYLENCSSNYMTKLIFFSRYFTLKLGLHCNRSNFWMFPSQRLLQFIELFHVFWKKNYMESHIADKTVLILILLLNLCIPNCKVAGVPGMPLRCFTDHFKAPNPESEKNYSLEPNSVMWTREL